MLRPRGRLNAIFPDRVWINWPRFHRRIWSVVSGRLPTSSHVRFVTALPS